MIDERLEAIQNLFLDDEQCNRLFVNRELFEQAAAALDVLGDTEVALEAYLNRECGTSEGAMYIATYGVLQGLYLQQDALLHLYVAFGSQINLKTYLTLKVVRDLRNIAICHPTRSDQPKPVRFAYIMRTSLSYGQMSLMTTSTALRTRFRNVHIDRLIMRQCIVIANLVEQLRAHMQAQGWDFED
jgi:hypothetical protein